MAGLLDEVGKTVCGSGRDSLALSTLPSEYSIHADIRLGQFKTPGQAFP